MVIKASSDVMKLSLLDTRKTECIGKGKASAPYEFGVKVSIVTTNARAPGGQFVLHARALPGNPYGQKIKSKRKSGNYLIPA
jgi:hypothetical protein